MIASRNACNIWKQFVGVLRRSPKFGKLLSSDGLKMKILPDLAARLHQDDDDDHINFVEKSIKEMVSLVKGSGSSKSRESVEKDLAGILDGNASRDVVDICGRVVLQGFKASVNSRDIPAVAQLFKVVQHCEGGILKAGLIKFIKGKYSRRISVSGGIDKAVSDMITWFLKATGDGKIIISRASRVSFVTTWLPIMGSFKKDDSLEDKFEEPDKAVHNVVESLPQVDQKRICVVWAEVYRSRGIDIATPFTLSKYLHRAHSKSEAK